MTDDERKTLHKLRGRLADILQRHVYVTDDGKSDHEIATLVLDRYLATRPQALIDPAE
jgi:hypothetical protein